MPVVPCKVVSPYRSVDAVGRTRTQFVCHDHIERAVDVRPGIPLDVPDNGLLWLSRHCDAATLRVPRGCTAPAAQTGRRRGGGGRGGGGGGEEGKVRVRCNKSRVAGRDPPSPPRHQQRAREGKETRQRAHARGQASPVLLRHRHSIPSRPDATPPPPQGVGRALQRQLHFRMASCCRPRPEVRSWNWNFNCNSRRVPDPGRPRLRPRPLETVR